MKGGAGGEKGGLAFQRSLEEKNGQSKDYVWVIDQVCSVKMAGYWLSSFFSCLWTETKSRSINSQKKNEANIQPS